MASRVLYAESFGRDYDEILRYHIEELSAVEAARSLVDAMDDAISQLAAMPESGPVSRKPGLAKRELRELPVRGYVVVYRIEGSDVYLLHLFHQSQDFEKLAWPADA